MKNRELLELAAKAYWGDEIDDVCSIRWISEDGAIGYTHADNQDHNGLDREFLWNPIADDGDALRLAVKLRIYFFIHLQGYSSAVTAQSIVDSYTELCGCDEMAATRRAIVRAAAAIQQSKEVA